MYANMATTRKQRIVRLGDAYWRFTFDNDNSLSRMLNAHNLRIGRVLVVVVTAVQRSRRLCLHEFAGY